MAEAKSAQGERSGYGTVREVAAHLRVSIMTVYRLMASGKLAFAKFGRARRIAWADVDRYVSGSMFGERLA
jgi:excisionase family DNA binding protein